MNRIDTLRDFMAMYIQAESIQRREELLHDIELANQMTSRESHMREREKENRIKELAQQVIIPYFINQTIH